MNLRQLFLNHVAQTSDMPLMLEIQRGEGIYLYDKENKPYLDLISGISVSNLGHCHPEVVEAVQSQVGKYMHTMVYGEFVMSPQVELASLLADNLPSNLNSVYFVNSGSEATEGAMKLAKRFTGKREIISCKKAYHGSTQGAASLMSDDYFTQAFRPLLPDIRHIEFNNENDLQSISEKTACVIMETVQAEWGVRGPENDYLKKVRKRCDETGTLLILDEIQVGFGRTGSLFAFEQYGIVPDILLLAKGMGGGMPIGAFVSSKEIMSAFMDNPFLGHITTFGGHPVTCAAALATLKVMLRENYISDVRRKSELFKKHLKHPAIKQIRSTGLIMAIEIGNFDFVLAIIHEALSNGIIVDWFLFNNESIRIAPPLIITDEEIEKACSILIAAINKVCN